MELFQRRGFGLDDARRVDVEILGEGAQPDAKVRVWRPEQRSAAAVIFEIVDVAADVRTGGAHRIDIAALPAVGARGAERERVAERQGDHCRPAPRRVPAVSAFGAADQLTLPAPPGSLAGDALQNAPPRAGPRTPALA